jgi:hypothetical protein
MCATVQIVGEYLITALPKYLRLILMHVGL